MIKKFALLVSVMLAISTFSGCAQTKVIDGVEYDTYGIANKSEKRNPNIQYDLVWGNIILGVIFCETIIAPIYFFGFSIWEPKGKETGVVGEVVK